MAFKLFDYNKETGKLFMDPGGIQRLRGLSSAPRFVSISGHSREGKSTLGNFLLASPVFETSDMVEGCTRGINCGISVDGSLAILDCEGLADVDQSGVPGLDAKLLATSLLCSDYSIFNAKKVLDETHIQEIGEMALTSSVLKPGAKLGKLMFVVRDAMPDAQELSPSEKERYLNKILEPDAGSAEDSDARSFLAEAFPPGIGSRGVAFLPRPCLARKGLDELKAKPAFVAAVAKLKEDIDRHAKTKAGGGADVVDRFQCILDGINEEVQAPSDSSYASYARHKLAEAVKTAQAEFKAALRTAQRQVKGHKEKDHLKLFIQAVHSNDSFSQSAVANGTEWQTFLLRQHGRFPFDQLAVKSWIATAVGFKDRYAELCDLVGATELSSVEQQLMSQQRSSAAALERCVHDEIKRQFRAAMSTRQVRMSLDLSRFQSSGNTIVGGQYVAVPETEARATKALTREFYRLTKNCWSCQHANGLEGQVRDPIVTEMRGSLLEPQLGQLRTAIRQLEVNLRQKQVEEERLESERQRQRERKQREKRELEEQREREAEQERQRQRQRQYEQEQQEREEERRRQRSNTQQLAMDGRTGQLVVIDGDGNVVGRVVQRGGGFGGYNPCFGGSFGGGFSHGGYGWG